MSSSDRGNLTPCAVRSVAGSFLSRLCRGPLLPLLLRPMSRWDGFGGRVRLRICQCTLVALQHAVGCSE